MLKNAKKIDLGFGKTLKKTVASGLCTTMMGLTPLCACAEEIFLDGTSATVNVTSNFCDDEAIGTRTIPCYNATGTLTTRFDGIYEGESFGATLSVFIDTFTGDELPRSLVWDDGVDRGEPILYNATTGETSGELKDAGKYLLILPIYDDRVTTALDDRWFWIEPATVSLVTENAFANTAVCVRIDNMHKAVFWNSPQKFLVFGENGRELPGKWFLVNSGDGNYALEFVLDDNELLSNYDFSSLGDAWSDSSRSLTLPFQYDSKPYLGTNEVISISQLNLPTSNE